MDHMMPGMDGIETTRVIRSLGYMNPVIALTANAVVGQAEMFKEKGFDDFIAKPIDIRHMNVILNKFVRDRHPHEVVEEARQQHKFSNDFETETIPQAAADPTLAKIFIRDASKSIAVLETICEKEGATGEDIRTYVINVHGIKSALANIGESELSAAAAKLEQAGRNGDRSVIFSKTPGFLRALRKLIAKITPREDDEAGEITDEDLAYLREKLLAVKTACAAYNKKAAKAALAEIEQKAWPSPTKELLETIAENLLHSRFKGVVSVVDEIIITL
jgi:CheY-like chemotaxis protein